MKAAVLEEHQHSLKVREVKDPSPGPGEVKVKVKACGVCGSDVHLVIEGTMKSSSFPRIPGHEASGVVEEVGEGVQQFQKGDRVVISAGTSCGKCKHCLAGKDNLCKDVGVFGYALDGSFADFVLVEERYLYHLPDSIPFDQGAILADAVSTPYHAIKYRGSIQPDDTVAVIGCGGLGIHGVAIARALTQGKVIAVDIDDGSLSNAEKYGADELLNIKGVKSPGKVLKEVSGGVDLLCDFSGYYPNIESSIRAMNTAGRIVMVGITKHQLRIGIPFILIEKGITIGGSFGADRRAIPELIELYTSGKLNLSHSITSHHPLEEVNQCLHDLHDRNGNPIRFIIEPELSH